MKGKEDKVKKFVEMGFGEKLVIEALQKCGYEDEQTMEYLISHS